MIRWLVSSVLVTAATVVSPSPTAAQSPRIALVDTDEVVVDAVRASVGPWSVDVLTVPPPTPGARMPDSADAARRLASEHDAQAVVWVSSTEQGPALWMYDATEDRVVARRIPQRDTVNPATASALALSVKTLLRHSVVAPPEERWSAPHGDPGIIHTPDRERETDEPAHVPTDGRDASEPGEDDPPPPSAAPAPARLTPALTARAALGMRLARTRPVAVEPRIGLGADVTPSPPLAVGVALSTGPGVPVDHQRLRGRLFGHEAHLVIVAQPVIGASYDLRLAVGGGVELSVLDGTLLEEGDAVSVNRLDPLLRASAELGWWPSPGIRLGLRLATSWLLLTQRYLVRGREVLRLAPLSGDADLTVSLPF